MTEVKIRYINITTDMFDSSKIKLIRKMPEGDAIINAWIQLICLAGTCNNGGDIKLSSTIPYTDEMLATVLGRDLPVVRLAIGVMQQLNMIQWQNGERLFIKNFEKYQSIDGLERIRLKNASRQKEWYNRQKQLQQGNTEANSLPNVSLTSTNVPKERKGKERKEEGEEGDVTKVDEVKPEYIIKNPGKFRKQKLDGIVQR